MVRRPPLEDRSVVHPWVSVTAAEPASRLSLRAPEDSVAAVSKALGLALPQQPKTSARKGKRVALWLGPDEWMIIDPTGAGLTAPLAKVTAFHSGVDISHRNTAILVSGEGAQATLSSGCPQDLSLAAFPVGACSRTVLAKIEIVLLRTGENEFRVECWRSFSDYAFAFLEDAARDSAF
ncbi:sarcosine oxidase subunit gamma [Mesorhizobium sp. CAU 1741]|uniref:sarcosine oxidase subunit gamma n=1 Tax=Mesorhizobium sp. CAU 1741 TaxID=3140366 RepID=UPI00325A9FFE